LPRGVGQGAGNAPPLWAGISSPLFEIMRHENFGGEAIDPTKSDWIWIEQK